MNPDAQSELDQSDWALAHDEAGDFLGGGRTAVATVDDGDDLTDFLTTDRPDNPSTGPGRWFTSRYDGTCSVCFADYGEGEEIRADGEGGWQGMECCGESDDELDPTEVVARQERRAARPRRDSPGVPIERGRYVMPHPTKRRAGKPTAWRATRMTTFVKMAADHRALTAWELRCAIVGLTLTPELLLEVADLLEGAGEPAAVVKAQRDALNAMVERAKTAAGSSERSRHGTVLHKHTEELDAGRRTLEQVPELYRRDAAAYTAELERRGYRPVPGLIERTTTVVDLSVMGTMDRVLLCPDGKYRIGDVKGLALTERIPTPDGWTTMGAVDVGDVVFDAYGKPCNVTRKSEIKQIGTYVVRFDDGSSVVCDTEHIWWTKAGRDNGGNHEPTAKPISEIIDTLRDPQGQAWHRVPVAGPLELPEAELPIDPYLLGCWLGDGAVRGGMLTKGRDLFDVLESDGHVLGPEQGTRSEKCVSRTVVGLTTALREAGLQHNKHIPAAYLRASAAQRLRLLQGLMDTDGCWNKARKAASFDSTDKALTLQVEELLLSLGQRPYVSEQVTSGFGKAVTDHRVSFTPVGINPFRLPRKAVQAAASTKPVLRSTRRVIVSVEPGPDVETACIGVDSPTNTYLCGDRMIPTHNSGDDPTRYAFLEIAAQLAGYQRGFNETGVAQWSGEGNPKDWTTWQWIRPVDDAGREIRVEDDFAVVMHVPFGSGECTLYEVDLAEGHRELAACDLVRSRQRVKSPTVMRPLRDLEPGPTESCAICELSGHRCTQCEKRVPHDSPVLYGESWCPGCFADAERDAASVPVAERVPEPHHGDMLAVVAEEVSRRHEPTWEERFAAVTTNAEASALYQLAKADVQELGVSRVMELVAIGKEALKNTPPF